MSPDIIHKEQEEPACQQEIRKTKDPHEETIEAGHTSKQAPQQEGVEN
jgi:hypothetical protein